MTIPENGPAVGFAGGPGITALPAAPEDPAQYLSAVFMSVILLRVGCDAWEATSVSCTVIFSIRSVAGGRAF